MNFYQSLQHNSEINKYLLVVESRRHRASLTRLLISAHKLKIETGRYTQNGKLSRDKRTCDFCKKISTPIYDEIHFIFDCMHNELERYTFYDELGLKRYEMDTKTTKLRYLKTS